ncbi:matrixin family metalloprotease [Methanolobus sp. WCC4]|uniref:matrixin family metalloprotease n=1 Tax=Methanolobus sp. WCC4 TaxID=3125784 RepID=UPI0030FC1FA3
MNKLIIGLVLAVFVLSTASIGVAADNKPDNVPSDIQKITFIHYAKSADNSRTEWDDEVEMYKLLPAKVRWYKTVEYEIYVEDSGLGTGEAFSAIKDSLKPWNDAIGFKLLSAEKGTEKSAPTTTAQVRDEKNVVMWSDLGPTGPGTIIAMNTFWFYTSTGEIVESDVQLNSNIEWGTNGEKTKMDVQNIATHEFGHNGLNDLYITKCTELTMYGYSAVGETKKRTLGLGDILGIKALYGE